MNIHYGCGVCAPSSWENFDSSPTIFLQRIPLLGCFFRKGDFPVFPGNIRKGNIAEGLKLPSESADLVYCSHVLEHLCLDDFRSALLETHRLLEKGGTFRFVLPDLEAAIMEYVESDRVDRASRFLETTLLGRVKRKKTMVSFMRDWVGGSKHLWMWDFRGIEFELRNAGFVDVRRAEYGDSSIAAFADVEDKGRWEGCLGVECRKPL
jgi:SAM-dependent methyltransferase